MEVILTLRSYLWSFLRTFFQEFKFFLSFVPIIIRKYCSSSFYSFNESSLSSPSELLLNIPDRDAWDAMFNTTRSPLSPFISVCDLLWDLPTQVFHIESHWLKAGKVGGIDIFTHTLASAAWAQIKGAWMSIDSLPWGTLFITLVSLTEQLTRGPYWLLNMRWSKPAKSNMQARIVVEMWSNWA